MKLRIRRLMIAPLVIACMFGLATVAFADNLTIGDSRYLGSIGEAQPSNPPNEISYINHLIDMALGTSETFETRPYIRTTVSCGACPDAVLTDANIDAGNTTINVNLGSGFTYLLGKYGQTDHIWYVVGLSGNHTITASAPGGGLSHWAAFNRTPTVPEPGSLLLLGSAFAIVGLVRRFKN